MTNSQNEILMPQRQKFGTVYSSNISSKLLTHCKILLGPDQKSCERFFNRCEKQQFEQSLTDFQDL